MSLSSLYLSFCRDFSQQRDTESTHSLPANFVLTYPLSETLLLLNGFKITFRISLRTHFFYFHSLNLAHSSSLTMMLRKPVGTLLIVQKTDCLDNLILSIEFSLDLQSNIQNSTEVQSPQPLNLLASLLRRLTRAPISGRSESGFSQPSQTLQKIRGEKEKKKKKWEEHLRVISLMKNNKFLLRAFYFLLQEIKMKKKKRKLKEKFPISYVISVS